MASIVSLTEAKSHLRVTQTTEDTLIQLYIDAAEDYIGKYLNKSNIPRTASIKAAAFLIIGGLYENRESLSDKQIYDNPAVFSLLYPYREDIGI